MDSRSTLLHRPGRSRPTTEAKLADSGTFPIAEPRLRYSEAPSLHGTFCLRLKGNHSQDMQSPVRFISGELCIFCGGTSCRGSAWAVESFWSGGNREGRRNSIRCGGHVGTMDGLWSSFSGVGVGDLHPNLLTCRVKHNLFWIIRSIRKAKVTANVTELRNFLGVESNPNATESSALR